MMRNRIKIIELYPYQAYLLGENDRWLETAADQNEPKTRLGSSVDHVQPSLYLLPVVPGSPIAMSHLSPLHRNPIKSAIAV